MFSFIFSTTTSLDLKIISFVDGGANFSPGTILFVDVSRSFFYFICVFYDINGLALYFILKGLMAPLDFLPSIKFFKDC